MTLNFRIIAKLCFLVVIIGFCMPMACDANGFQIASGDVASTELSLSLYGLFITAIIGFLIGIILLMKKNIPVIIDWIIIIICILCGTIPFFMNLKEYGDYYQSGLYIILVGYGLILIFQIVSMGRMENNLLSEMKNNLLSVKPSEMKNNLLSVKTIVAIGIGAALYFVLMRFVAIPSGVPNTSLNIGIAVLAVFAAIFGPIAGFLIGFIGHILTDLTWGGVWWSWVISSGLFGLAVGLCWKFLKIEEGSFNITKAVSFNIVQILANAVVWIGIAPTLDILIYSEPANKVYLQGFTAAALNAAVVLILGTLLLFGYTKTIAKSGSLKAE